VEIEEAVFCARINSPFVGGGVAPDAIRDYTEPIEISLFQNNSYGVIRGNGLLEYAGRGSQMLTTAASATADAVVYNLKFSNRFPTGPENSPRTLSVQVWRRVS